MGLPQIAHLANTDCAGLRLSLDLTNTIRRPFGTGLLLSFTRWSLVVLELPNWPYTEQLQWKPNESKLEGLAVLSLGTSSLLAVTAPVGRLGHPRWPFTCRQPKLASAHSLRQHQLLCRQELPVSTALHRYGRPLGHTQPGYVHAGGTLSCSSSPSRFSESESQPRS
jgi:hypothetical protein